MNYIIYLGLNGTLNNKKNPFIVESNKLKVFNQLYYEGKKKLFFLINKNLTNKR